jgi:RNA polymerase sigma-70 factor (ECF subfamily)
MPRTIQAARRPALGDVALVCAITRGNGDALAEAYARHASGVHNIASHLCGPTRAKDIVQEVFLALWQHPERYDCDRGSLRAFLTMQTRGRCIDLLRSEGSRRARERAEGLQPSNAGTGDVDIGAMSRLQHDELHRALTAIPDPERDAIVLAFFGGHTYREVATMLGQPEGTVKSRIRAGLARLGELLGDVPPLPAT